jgi:large subunit ribosomal protein L18
MYTKEKIKQNIRLQRKKRVRAKIFGTKERPRLSVFRSLKGLNVQLIDDTQQRTLLSMNTKSLEGFSGSKTLASAQFGRVFGKAALERGFQQAVFDRGCYAYHGRVRAFAEGVREAGMKL